MKLHNHPRNLALPQNIIEIYLASFPETERRPVEDLRRRVASGEINLYLMADDDQAPVGFITSWHFGDFRYVEHFAVDPATRGLGLGGKALEDFIDLEPTPVILEVEPAETSVEARRRIAFYQRHGFDIVDKSYIQPPYTAELSPIPLHLMATADLNTANATKMLHSRVYNVR